MYPTLWPQSPVPESPGSAWEWEVGSPSQLHYLRAELRARFLDGADPDDCDHLLLAVDELTTNGLRHGVAPIAARVVVTDQGWLVDVTDGSTDHAPEPAHGRDPAHGGMGLYLVAELTCKRGWSVAGGRKHVWACLPSGG